MNIRTIILFASIFGLFAVFSCKNATQPNTSDSIDTVFVQGGTFMMGNDTTDADESPKHSVTVKSFYMLKTEVTQKMYYDVVLWATQHGGSTLRGDPGYYKGDKLPVESVSWNDVNLWLTHLNAKEGTTKYRLPTEAEWEYAARGGAKSAGYIYSGSNNLDAVAWDGLNSGNKSHDVQTKQPNELGLYDMTGNVWEYCSDWYGPYPSTAQIDPTGPANGNQRVIRGGSWPDATIDYLRATKRLQDDPNDRSRANIGFRFVKDL